jgi:hypothetical protein
MLVIRNYLSVVLMVTVALALGCGGAGDKFGRQLVPVKGTVTVKGAPVKANNNLFLVFEKTGERPESIEVKSDGTYSGSASGGENQVTLQIYGPADALGPIKPEYTKGGKLKATVEAGKEVNLDLGE